MAFGADLFKVSLDHFEQIREKTHISCIYFAVAGNWIQRKDPLVFAFVCDDVIWTFRRDFSWTIVSMANASTSTNSR